MYTCCGFCAACEARRVFAARRRREIDDVHRCACGSLRVGNVCRSDCPVTRVSQAEAKQHYLDALQRQIKDIEAEMVRVRAEE